MPPKVKITREDIISAAVDTVRKQGPNAINARTIAAILNCSTQPIFSNFSNMEELHLAVAQKAEALFQDYMQREVESGKYPAYKANGMAYIRFARAEKELFKLLYMCDRSGELIPPDSDVNNSMEAIVHANTGLDDTRVKLFHLEMWACVHGIASMFATGFLDLEWDLVSNMLTDIYQGLRKQYALE
jgi:AcrR family transcriptional regulator